ncbi:MAG TPA: lytic transglycosylase domain-containing protein [Myxococcaceae bacterium]|nr:lytic transglycosylase domain-containing protein [Myxococcaceae bacterium]
MKLLKDRLLVGHVLAQRYLSKTYKASYKELADWLQNYSDEGDAAAIHALAVQRKSAGGPAPSKPGAWAPALRYGGEGDLDALVAADASRTGTDLSDTYEPKDELKRIAKTNPAKAEALLNAMDARHLLDDADLDDVRAAIADAYMSAGEAKRALAINARRKVAAQPLADWNAGLAEWRAKRYVEARQHFEAAAKSPDGTPGLVAGAAFWTARAELRNRRPELVNYWLGIAAQEPYTFYGLLARRTLGVDSFFDFDSGAFSSADVRTLLATTSGRRVLALIQVGENQRAEAELRAVVATKDGTVMPAVEALADRANMPALSFQLAGFLSRSDGRNHDRALYPVPRWQPKGGFTVDRALLFAMMRQESQFMPQVRSPAGALGVMQLMPATARSMAARAGLPAPDQGNLTDPELNLTLAQEYITHLLSTDRIGNNLLLITAAYNAGPGPIPKWLASDDVRDDPLLFMESIPNQETHGYVQRVLANYWIYRMRLGQPTPDLDALAAGSWPTYTALDPPGGQGGRYAAN